jgi:hypothetical protein
MIQYVLFAAAAGDALQRRSEEYVTAMENMAEMITANSGHGNDFPFVVMPTFEVIGGQTREITHNDVVMWVPFVTERQREEWSNFTDTEKEWYNESVKILQTDANRRNDTYIYNAEFRSYIWEGRPNVVEAPQGNPTSILAPLWESSPPPFSISSCNYNVLEDKDIEKAVNDMFSYRDAIVGTGKVATDDLVKQFIDPEDLSKYVHTDAVSRTNIPIYENPHSTHIQPVFLHLNDKESELVGLVLSIITWDHFMMGLLHSVVTGVVAVLENTCDQSFTYELHGDLVRYYQSYLCLFCCTSTANNFTRPQIYRSLST